MMQLMLWLRSGIFTTLRARAMNDQLKAAITKLIEEHGLRMVAENVVEVCHDKAEGLKGQGGVEWRTVACKLGNVVHWRDMAWPC